MEEAAGSGGGCWLWVGDRPGPDLTAAPTPPPPGPPYTGRRRVRGRWTPEPAALTLSARADGWGFSSVDAGTPGLARLRAASGGRGGRVTAGLSPRGPRGCPTPCRGRGASHTGRFWGVGPALTGEAEEREEGEEGAGGDACWRGRGHPVRPEGLRHFGEGAGTHGWGGTSGKLGPLGKMGEPTPPCLGGQCPPAVCTVGAQQALFHTWGHPRLPRNGTSARVLLPCAPQGLLLSSPPPPTPCPSHPPHPPTEAQASV